MDDVLLEEESVKFLGMYLDRGLSWDFHIDSICSKDDHVGCRGRNHFLFTPLYLARSKCAGKSAIPDAVMRPYVDKWAV
ncbi:hypothetical protein J6590_051386 [Homalodisca vitripennis]|nr:hypothetical protein J6590_051386 [Homalodisca vitripennis]